jgi:hypothetical protein
MALIPAKIIARLRGTYTSDVAELSYDWAMRADGEVVRRMTAVNGHRQRYPWQLVTQVPAARRQIARTDHTYARAMLAEIARQSGHEVAELSD